MENQLYLMEWCKKMGYDSQIPESLGNICTKSTWFIWSELMQNARPKQEVNNIKNNVVINRLRCKPLNKQDEFSYPIKDIVLFSKKQNLERKLNNLQSTIDEKKHIIKNQSKNNKIKYITLEKLKCKVRENKEREYILNRKCMLLEENIENAESTLTFAKNLTPVELEESPNTTEITETLQCCAEKLELLLKEIPVHHNSNSFNQKSFKFYSAQKQSKTQSNFEKHLIMSERKHSEKITVLKQGGSSVRHDRNDKENLGCEKKISKNLFGTTREQNKNSENKRESLGILPDAYLNNNEMNFLTESDSLQDIYVSDLYCINEIGLNAFSPKETNSNFRIPFSECATAKNRPKNCAFDKLYNNKFVSDHLSNLLYNHNRQIIWNTFRTLNDNLNLNIIKNIIVESGKDEKGKSVSQEDIAELQFLHVQTELQILKLKAILKDIMSKIIKKKKIIYLAIRSKGLSTEQVEDIGRLFELQLDDIYLDVTLNEMKKEINSVKKIEDNNDLQITQGKITQTKEDIILKIDSIKRYISNIYDTLQSTVRIREKTVACVRKLGPFVEDLTWSAPLTGGLCTIETKTFEKFPLEYNKRCIYTDSRTYYRDISDSIPMDAELDNDTLNMLADILESPFSPPETIVLHILKCKMKLNSLKCLPNHSLCDSLKELQTQESYVQYALDKLNSIIFSSSANKTLSTVDHMKKIMEIWLEMPLKNFISPKRIVEGHHYKFYEKQYDSFYNC